MIKEFCAENFTNIEAALKAGANRIELCDNLAVGGTTPSLGVIKEVVKIVHQYGGAVMTMIRPRGGNFVYNNLEIQIMLADIAVVREMGGDGVVFGCLTAEKRLDYQAMEQLIHASKGMEITFHMAFDEIDKELQFEVIDWLADRGVGRILSHGGSKESLILDNFDHLQKLIEYAKNRMIILPGGQITYRNCDLVMNTLHITEVHGTKIVRF